MTTKEKVSRPRIDDDKFVKTWVKVFNKGGHLQDVADEIGCSLAGASSKAKSLIEDGVPLPKLERAPRKKNRDVKSLKEIIKNEIVKK